MSERITIRHLERFATALNRSLKRPEKYFGAHGFANVGHFHIEQQSGRYALVETRCKAGSTNQIASGDTARDCYMEGHAWFNGYLYREAREPQRVTMREAQRLTEGGGPQAR